MNPTDDPRYTPTSIRMYPSGKLVNPFGLAEADIHIEDIAHHLANEARFAGGTRERYSVAEHSVRVSWVVQGDARVRLRALLHDSSEAYLKDIPRPLKKNHAFDRYRAYEKDAEHAIAHHYGLEPWDGDAAIKKADLVLCSTEARDLTRRPADWQLNPAPLQGVTIHPWSAEDARDIFLRRFADLVVEVFGMDHALGYCRACQGVVGLGRAGIRPLIRGWWRYTCSDCGGDYEHQLLRAEPPTSWLEAAEELAARP